MASPSSNQPGAAPLKPLPLLMTQIDQITQQDSLVAMNDLPDQSVDVTLTDPPYPNRMGLFPDAILDGYAGLYLACRKTKNFVVFFWSNDRAPQAPPGWYEVARHIWHKPDCKSITHYENIIVWARDWKRKTSRVWSIPILDYRSLRDWKPHPTQKPVRLIRYLLELYTKEGDTVLDPFVGTGTTAVACKQMKRHFIAIDNDPEYVKMAQQRLTSRNKDDEPAKKEPAPDLQEEAAEEVMEEQPSEDIPQDYEEQQDEEHTPQLAHLGPAKTSRRPVVKNKRPPKATAASNRRQTRTLH